jgi:TusE/DsrC/DsvC family sulfur relay protein
MPVTDIAGHEVHVNDEGFLTEYDEWNREIAEVLATNIGIEMTDRHWDVVEFIRSDFQVKGETPTTRRVQNVGGIPTKEQFTLFPKKPGRKMSYVAGLPKPKGCV